MEVENKIIDHILGSYRSDLRDRYDAYRNHVYRVYNLALILHGSERVDRDTLAVAAAFHDLGIWTHHTLDYLAPSMQPALDYATTNGIDNTHIAAIIYYHHKLTVYQGVQIVESFRRADLIDLSFGLIRFGVSSGQYIQLKAQFPFHGFQTFIFSLILKRFFTHPLSPLPMLKL